MTKAKITFNDLPSDKFEYINNDLPEQIIRPIEPISPYIPRPAKPKPKPVPPVPIVITPPEVPIIIEPPKLNYKYSYFFGLDNIDFLKKSIDSSMCFISQDINIGMLSKNEYIEIASDYSEGFNGSIEFYIIDGSEAKAILPINTDKVYNEKIFFGLRPRFLIDENEPLIIKEKGILTDKSLEQVISSNSSKYTIDYTPIDAYSLHINNEVIKVKVIIRCYDLSKALPYVKNITIRKYGRSNI